MSRVKSSDLVKFRSTLNISVDKKYYKSTSHDQESYLSIRRDFFSKDKKFLIFFEKTRNSLFFLTMIKSARVFEQEISK
jgi:hypothetical protein